VAILSDAFGLLAGSVSGSRTHRTPFGAVRQQGGLVRGLRVEQEA